MTYLEEFKKSIHQNDYPRFLKLWEEYCYSDQFEAEELRDILAEAKNSELAKPLGRHVTRALTLWNKLPPSQAKHEIITLIYDIQTINSEDLAETAYLYLHQLHGKDEYFDLKLRLIGLKTLEDFQGAIRHYELLTHLQKGNFVFHTAGWGTGEVVDVSLIREEVSLEFEYVLGIKTFSFKNAMKTLIPLSQDHFLAKRFGFPDDLEKEAKENPAEFLRFLLKDLGPKSAAEIKEEVADLVIPQDEWNRWWSNARSKIKKDPMIESPKGTSDRFRLLKQEISFESELYKNLEMKPSIDQTIQLIYTFFKDFPTRIKEEDFRKTLSTKLNELLEFNQITPFQKLQILLLLEDLTKQDLASSYLNEISSFEPLNNEVDILALKKKILQKILENRKDWNTIFFSLIFSIQQNLMRDYMFSELFSRPEFHTKLLQEIKKLLEHPMQHPSSYVWYFSKIIENEKVPFADVEGKKKFFENFLVLLNHLEQHNDYRDLAKKMVSMLIGNKYQLIRSMFEISTLEEIREYLLLFSKCSSFSSQDQKIIISLAEVVFPILKQEKTSDDTDKAEVVWTTEAGFEKIRKRIEELATTETLQSAKEINEARAHGDLRENAEYKAALEKRRQSQNELKKLTELFNHARILKKEDVSKDTVGVGNIVVCQNSRKELVTFVILGPWDADPEKNILSFKSQLAQNLIGLSVKDRLSFQGEEYIVKEIRNYFE